jgi:hypothetical protein
MGWRLGKHKNHRELYGLILREKERGVKAD